MAVPQDPYFWKRFSTAVHLDEEAAQVPRKRVSSLIPPLFSLLLPSVLIPPPLPQPPSCLTATRPFPQFPHQANLHLPHRPESWHASTVRKNRGSHLRICLTFWILLFAIIAIIVVVCLVLVKTGVLKKIHIGGDGHRIDTGGFQGWLNKIFGTGGDNEKSSSGSGQAGSARRRDIW